MGIIGEILANNFYPKGVTERPFTQGRTVRHKRLGEGRVNGFVGGQGTAVLTVEFPPGSQNIETFNYKQATRQLQLVK